MSMDEMLLNELYGSEQVREDEEIKQAQVELVEAVAAEAGVNLNELDDEELAKFAHYVLSDEDELQQTNILDQEKLAEADLMGRQMARSYLDELSQSGSGENMINDAQIKVASAMQNVSDAWEAETMSKTASYADQMAHALVKIATDGESGGESKSESTSKKSDSGEDAEGRLKNLKKKMSGYGQAIYGKHGDQGGSLKKMVGIDRVGDEAFLGKRGLRAGGAAAVGAGALYGGYKGVKALMGSKKKKNQEKKASLFLNAGYEALALAELYEPEEFAKEAEYRAAEILAANGIHPQTFQDIQPEEIKLASFPGVEYAADEHEAAALREYNEMLDNAALHIIDNLIEE